MLSYDHCVTYNMLETVFTMYCRHSSNTIHILNDSGAGMRCMRCAQAQKIALVLTDWVPLQNSLPGIS
ncbi:hypothetical protein AA0312_2794 [Acetobacter tropicalis NRIC 0312]|nr:hypothetical protein ATR1_025d0007 [Acetobacter tropicalis]GBR72197.1 hypothetical protein AA0312_2794 [Acetobacter tropicalis NRIC 0312]